MPKKLICDRCKKEVGEIQKGKLKKDAVIICGECNYRLLTIENAKGKDNSSPFDFLRDICKGN